mmetsp:Transcript_171/g.410  ORF Transcript_171/g.410 Transcript_171/m.410 type:complete len:338 (-) Transcript_171:271-1284(-)
MPQRWSGAEVQSVEDKLDALRAASSQTMEQAVAAGGDPDDQGTAVIVPMPDYDTWWQAHNSQFDTNRSLAAFKKKVENLAKKKGIKFQSGNCRWSDADKDRLIKLVQEGPLITPWSNIAQTLHRSEYSVKSMYKQEVPAMDHVRAVAEAISHEKLNEILNELKFTCEGCGGQLYYSPCLWDSKQYCRECHDAQFNEEIRVRWRRVQEYSQSIGKTECNLCHKAADFSGNQRTYFHFDHINMFEKESSVCDIVRWGRPLEEAFAEIDQCQLLCISCHRVITTIESSCGFLRVKKKMNKEKSDEVVTEQEEMRNEVSQIYARIMEFAQAYLQEVHSVTQ